MVQLNSMSQNEKKKVCVYCGSRMGKLPEYQQIAVETGHALARNSLDLVYGGGRVGLMGLVADAVLGQGGKVYGVIPGNLFSKEVAHLNLTELFEVESMHERKAKMEQLSDAFLILPGGFGTMDEFFEIVTWRQLEIHRKPIVVLNSNAFYEPLKVLIQSMIDQAFVSPEHFDFIHFETTIDAALNRLNSYLK